MVIEVVIFRLRPSTDEVEFRAHDGRAQTEFFYLQPGLLRRTTARGPDGEWAVVSLWGSVEEAQAALDRSKDDPAAAAFWSLVDAGSVESRLYETPE